MRVLSRPYVVTLLLPCTALSACSRPPAPRFPGAPVVLVSIDTLRADHLPAYGYPHVKTPHIDRLRRDAILYERAYSPAPLTLPAHVSLLTGLLPFEHGVRDNLGYRFDPKAHSTLATLLRAKGYATGSFVSAHVLRGGTGLASGFDVYDDQVAAPADVGVEALGRVQRRGDETLAAARSWLEGVAPKPFLLFLHIYEPHSPYDPPEPYRSQAAHPYDGEIAKSDEVVGGLLDELRRSGVYERAIVVLVSDHGEGLGEHGEDEHGILLYRWALHVPLLVKLPGGLRAGSSVRTPVQLIDLLPTLANLLDLPAPKGLRGRSLVAEPSQERRIYAETFYPRIHLGWSELRSLLDERWQYIEGRRRELYELREDPSQLTNRVATEGQTARAFQTELARYPARLTRPTAVSTEELEKLAALGYLGGSVEAGAGPLPDPRESIPALAEVKAAFRLAAAGRDAEAVTAFRKILDVYPLLLDARYELGQALARLGRLEEAYDAFGAALRASPSLAGPISLALGRVCLKLGRHDEADANAQVALSTSPAQAHELRARIALARDDLAGAEREARQVTGEASAQQGAAIVLAEVHGRRAQLPQALALLEDAKRRGAERGLEPVIDLDFLRGDTLARLGRHAEAEAAFNEEIRRYPRNAQAYTRLAIVYGLQRRTRAEVNRLLETMVAASPDPGTCELAAKTLESMGDQVGARAWRRRGARIATGR
jgi:arylsulfatase A-like enzyme